MIELKNPSSDIVIHYSNINGKEGELIFKTSERANQLSRI
jgi:hypothetical protein